MDKTAKILIVDDDPGNMDYVARILANFQIESYTNPKKALASFRKDKYDLIITDQKMPEMTGINLIKSCKEHSNDFFSIIISAYTESDDLIDAVNSNSIYKYIIKPFSPNILLQHVHRAYESLCLLREKNKLEQKLQEDNVRLNTENKRLKESGSEFGTNRLAGDSPELLGVKERIETYANSDSSVLITGETGTGKELVAQAIHDLSMRSTKPFIKINCTTLSQNLIESELFGHEKGAFTGAGQYKKGFFETANGGTIFLDEIGDLSLEIQPILLRILQFGTYFPVGGREEKYTDVRIITATNTNLEDSVRNGKFRKDLFHRLNILRLRIPPLRDRKSDIPIILKKLLNREYSGFEDISLEKGAIELLFNQPFPGNVRELETYVHRIQLINGSCSRITTGMVKQVLEPETSSTTHLQSYNNPENNNLKSGIENMEKEQIIKALEENNYNITKAANHLGISRQGLHNKIKRYQIPKR